MSDKELIELLRRMSPRLDMLDCEYVLTAADRIEELEAKLSESEALLAKSVDALGEAIYLLDPDEEDIAKETGLHRIVTTYAELTGGKDE